MLKSIFKAALTAAAIVFATACTEEIDKSNRYTFTEETMADYLENREEKFSSLIKIYKQANMMGILQTYGNYTMFAPTNEAIERSFSSRTVSGTPQKTAKDQNGQV